MEPPGEGPSHMATKSTTEITGINWGKVEVTIDGAVQTFKDCKVWPGGAEAWDWKQTGTRHKPGTQPTDIAHIVEQGIDVLVLTRGMELALHICPETTAYLKERNIEFHIEETSFAVQLFNMLSRQGRRVGGIFHSTC